MQEIKTVTFFTKKDGKIDRVQPVREGEKPFPEDREWYKSFAGHITREESLDWYEEDGEGNIVRKLTDEEYLKKQGKEDPRTVYHDKKREKPDVTIYNIDASPPEGFTKESPIPGEAFQFFDEKKGKFTVDTAKKAIAEKEAELGRLKFKIAEAEQKRLRSKFAIDDDAATEEDMKYNTEYKAEIAALRPQIKDVEKELKALRSA